MSIGWGALLIGLAVTRWLGAPPCRLATIVGGVQEPSQGARARQGHRWFGRRRGSPVVSGADVDVLVLLTLLDVALRSGASVTRTLGAVGHAVGGEQGRALTTVTAALSLGADWDGAWDQAPPGLDPVRDCLRGSWTAGSAAGPGLHAAAAQVRRRRRQASREAAGRLGVTLVLPLGLCFLPACVLLGLVPLALSLASGLLP